VLPPAPLGLFPNQAFAFPAILTVLPAAVQAQINVCHAQALISFLMVLVSQHVLLQPLRMKLLELVSETRQQLIQILALKSEVVQITALHAPLALITVFLAIHLMSLTPQPTLVLILPLHHVQILTTLTLQRTPASLVTPPAQPAHLLPLNVPLATHCSTPILTPQKHLHNAWILVLHQPMLTQKIAVWPVIQPA